MTIEAKDLRVGSCLEYFIEDSIGGNQWILNIVDSADILECEKVNKIFNEFYRSIPLTVNVLLKCGFKKYSNSGFGNYLLTVKLGAVKEISFYITASTGIIYIEKGQDVVRLPLKVSELHEFQNLHLALTQIELNYQHGQ